MTAFLFHTRNLSTALVIYAVVTPYIHGVIAAVKAVM